MIAGEVVEDIFPTSNHFECVSINIKSCVPRMEQRSPGKVETIVVMATSMVEEAQEEEMDDYFDKQNNF